MASAYRKSSTVVHDRRCTEMKLEIPWGLLSRAAARIGCRLPVSLLDTRT